MPITITRGAIGPRDPPSRRPSNSGRTSAFVCLSTRVREFELGFTVGMLPIVPGGATDPAADRQRSCGWWLFVSVTRHLGNNPSVGPRFRFFSPGEPRSPRSQSGKPPISTAAPAST